jgi:uncharacterized heparinase superfamily protein
MAVAAPRHRLIVVPWLRTLGHRLVLPSWLAITIGPVIFAWRSLSEAELAHELEHVRQWRRHGLAFVPCYLRESARAVRQGRDRYHDNRFEVAARAAAERVGRRTG